MPRLSIRTCEWRQNSDYRYRFLRASGERPRSRHTSNKGKKIAPPHATPETCYGGDYAPNGRGFIKRNGVTTLPSETFQDLQCVRWAETCGAEGLCRSIRVFCRCL